MEPKKTALIFVRIPEPLKEDFERSLGSIGFTKSTFLRACVESLIRQARRKEKFELPIQFATVKHDDPAS